MRYSLRFQDPCPRENGERDPPLTLPKRGIIRISYLRNCSVRFISPEATKKVINRNKRLESRVTALSVPTLVGDIVTITK